MFSIYSTVAGVTVCLHEDTVSDPRVKVIDPVLTLEENSAGSLTFKLAPNNAGYNDYEVTEYTTTGEQSGTEVYTLLDNKPPEWSTEFASYFTKSGDDYIPVAGVPATGGGVVAPEWAANTYYEMSATDTLTPITRQVNLVERMAAVITVFQENQNGVKTEIWEGRVLSESKDFNNLREIYCEGTLAYLNDTIQPQKDYTGSSIGQFIDSILSIHNGKVSDNKKIVKGVVTIPESVLDRKTEYGSTWEAISNLVKDYKIHLRYRKDNGVRKLDFLADYGAVSTQKIILGKNLLDFTRKWDMSKLCTAVLPTGAVTQSSTSSSVGEALTPITSGGAKYTKTGAILKIDSKANNLVKIVNASNNKYRINSYTLQPDTNYYISSRLHGGYASYVLYESTGKQHSYSAAGSENSVNMTDLVDKKFTTPPSSVSNTYTLKVCSWGDDILPTVKAEIPPTTTFDKYLGVETYGSVDEYSLSLERPYNWDDVYKSYYRKNGNTYTAVTDLTPPEWTINTFYSKSKWHENGSPYVINQTALTKYGWIEKHLEFKDVTTVAELYTAAKNWLQSGQFDEMTLDLTAVDLVSAGMSEEGVDAIALLDQVQVISEPHGLNRSFPVTKLEIPLDKPADRKFSLGYSSADDGSLTAANASSASDIQAQFAAIPSASSILDTARQNATELIDGSMTPSAVTLVRDPNDNTKITEICIYDNKDPDLALKMWRWNIGGLGFRKRNSTSASWGEYELAMDNAGNFLANFITAGTMVADRILGGYLRVGGIQNGTGGGGIIQVYDASNQPKVICQFDSTGGTITGSLLTNGTRNVEPDRDKPAAYEWARMVNGMLLCGTQSGGTYTERGRVDGNIVAELDGSTYYGTSIEANRHSGSGGDTVSGGIISLCCEKLAVCIDNNPHSLTYGKTEKITWTWDAQGNRHYQSGGIVLPYSQTQNIVFEVICGIITNVEKVDIPQQQNE